MLLSTKIHSVYDFVKETEMICSLLNTEEGIEPYFKFMSSLFPSEYENCEELISINEINSIKKTKNKEMMEYFYKNYDKFPIEYSLSRLSKKVYNTTGKVMVNDNICNKIRNTNSEVIYHRMNSKTESRRYCNLPALFILNICDKNKWACCNSIEELENNSSSQICIFCAPNGFKFPQRHKIKDKNPDIIIKITYNGIPYYYLGEIKLITDTGGAQKHQYNDAISYLNVENGFCIIDGEPHLDQLYRSIGKNRGKSKQYEEVSSNDKLISLYDFEQFVKNLLKELYGK